jgi:hypothetical protein
MTDETGATPPARAPLDVAAFREVVRHPRAHALVLQQYRLGEYAGVVALRRLLAEMRPEGRLHRAMTIHHRDEERHTTVFSDWIYRLGVEPEPLPADVEGYFTTGPGDFQAQRQLLEQLPPALRRIAVFAGVNAIERAAFEQFDAHLQALERREDVAELQQVIAEEKFHLSYVEHELDRQTRGEHAAFVTVAVEQARLRFGEFVAGRRREGRAAIERLLGAGA